MTREELLALIRAGDFGSLVGLLEDVQIEFKGQPYQLEHEHEKFELAKDVSALANADGGVIVLGARTERSEDSPIDRVAEIRLLRREMVSEQQYIDVVTDRVYPRIQNLRVEFMPSPDDGKRGMVVIDVPAQADAEKLFLVQKPMSETRVPGWMIGVAVRSVGRVDARRVGEIHALISRGFTISARLDELADEIALVHERLGTGQLPIEPASPAHRLLALLNQRMAELEAPTEDD